MAGDGLDLDGMMTGFDGDFEREPLSIEFSRLGALKAEVDCLDLSRFRGPDADTRSTLDIEDRSMGLSRDTDPSGKDGLALEMEPDLCGFCPDGFV